MKSPILLVLVLSALLAAGQQVAAQEQSRGQQGCINAVHKAAAKVLKTQAQEIYRCASLGLRGKESAPLACATGDSRGKIQKALDFSQTYFDKKCVENPDFGISSVAEFGEAGQQAPLLLLQDVFGANPETEMMEDERIEAACIATRADCRVCQAINATSGASTDCDLFDDDLANLSCQDQLQSACGNGNLEAGEECDNGAGNSDIEPGACRSDRYLVEAQDWVPEALDQAANYVDF